MSDFRYYQDKINSYLAGLNLIDDANYLLLNPGRRLRPVLTCLWARHIGTPIQEVLPYAAAVEIIHTASLIHDDLPCMDNADTRRDLLCLHKTVGEARAVVVGDYLITQAYKVILNNTTHDSSAMIGALNLLQLGSECVMLGQIGELVDCDISYINRSKTASLFGSACALGCICNNMKLHQLQSAHEFGICFGFAYQYLDDLRDGDGASKTLKRSEIDDIIQENVNKCKHIAQDDPELMQLIDAVFK